MCCCRESGFSFPVVCCRRLIKLGFINPATLVDPDWAQYHPKFGTTAKYMLSVILCVCFWPHKQCVCCVTRSQIRARVLELRSRLAYRGLFRRLFVFAWALSPLNGFVALAYTLVAAYFMFTGNPPLNTTRFANLLVLCAYPSPNRCVCVCLENAASLSWQCSCRTLLSGSLKASCQRTW